MSNRSFLESNWETQHTKIFQLTFHWYFINSFTSRCEMKTTTTTAKARWERFRFSFPIGISVGRSILLINDRQWMTDEIELFFSLSLHFPNQIGSIDLSAEICLTCKRFSLWNRKLYFLTSRSRCIDCHNVCSCCLNTLNGFLFWRRFTSKLICCISVRYSIQYRMISELLNSLSTKSINIRSNSSMDDINWNYFSTIHKCVRINIFQKWFIDHKLFFSL